MSEDDLIPNLFRTEYRKIVAVLCRRFGFEHLETAEDIASETFVTATHTWGITGLPANPVAWLYKVAKNKAANHLRRESILVNKVLPAFAENSSEPANDNIDLSPQNISDSQLQMMFAICHPCIAQQAQIALSLRVLCGFGIEEIASAFLSNKETINKRLLRAKETLRTKKVSIGLPSGDKIAERLNTVLTTIYLLFNEGYYSTSENSVLRKNLCLEAMRLCTLLVEHHATNKPEVNALLALMCFHASRFDARLTTNGEIVLYDEQDTSLWDNDLVSKGAYFMAQAASGDDASKYHLEAGIAYWNTQKVDTPEKWQRMLQLYDSLLQLEYSPNAAINRTWAFAKLYGNQKGIVEAHKLNLVDNRYYYALLAELYKGIDNSTAKMHLHRTLSMARSAAEKQAIRKRLEYFEVHR